MRLERSLSSDGGAAFSDALTALNRALELLRRDHGSPPRALAVFVEAWADAMEADGAEGQRRVIASAPTPHLTRESLEERARLLTAQIKELPVAEVFRLVGDFIDTRQWAFARQTAAYAVTRLKREAPSGQSDKPPLELVS